MTEKDGSTLASAGFRSVSKADLQRTRNLCAAMLVLSEKATTEDLENLGVTPADLSDVRAVLDAQVRALPTARNTVLATLSGTVGKEYALTAYARAQRGLHALAPLVVLRLAEKIDDDQAPGSTRVLLELAKGLGLLAPAEALSAPKRVALFDLETERGKPLDALKNDVLRHSA